MNAMKDLENAVKAVQLEYASVIEANKMLQEQNAQLRMELDQTKKEIVGRDATIDEVTKDRNASVAREADMHKELLATKEMLDKAMEAEKEFHQTITGSPE